MNWIRVREGRGCDQYNSDVFFAIITVTRRPALRLYKVVAISQTLPPDLTKTPAHCLELWALAPGCVVGKHGPCHHHWQKAGCHRNREDVHS